MTCRAERRSIGRWMTDLVTWAEMSRFKWWLYLLGPILEGCGIIVILFPDVLPWLLRWWSWLQRHTRTLANGVRRMLGIRHDTRLAAQTGTLTSVGEHARLVIAPGESAPLEDKVRYLMQKSLELDGAVDALRERFEKSEKETANRFDQARREVEAWTKEAIRTEIARYGAGRIVGSVLLIVGLVFSGFANFIN
jgi:hypothetical protein